MCEMGERERGGGRRRERDGGWSWVVSVLYINLVFYFLVVVCHSAFI